MWSTLPCIINNTHGLTTKPSYPGRFFYGKCLTSIARFAIIYNMKTIQISKAELLRLYTTLTVREAAEKLDIHPATFYKLLDRAGIERKNADRIDYELID